MNEEFISACCEGVKCSVCSKPATHKIGEEIQNDDPFPNRHNLTAYVCTEHFNMVLKPYLKKSQNFKCLENERYGEKHCTEQCAVCSRYKDNDLIEMLQEHKCSRIEVAQCTNSLCVHLGRCSKKNQKQFVDWNEYNLDQLVTHLKNEFGGRSSGTSKAVFELIKHYEQTKWISVDDRLPEIKDDDSSDLVFCVGRKGTHRHEPDCGYIEYEIMQYVKLEKPDMKNSKGEWIQYGWSNRWWDNNPDLYAVEYWMPLPKVKPYKK